MFPAWRSFFVLVTLAEGEQSAVDDDDDDGGAVFFCRLPLSALLSVWLNRRGRSTQARGAPIKTEIEPSSRVTFERKSSSNVKAFMLS